MYFLNYTLQWKGEILHPFTAPQNVFNIQNPDPRFFDFKIIPRSKELLSGVLKRDCPFAFSGVFSFLLVYHNLLLKPPQFHEVCHVAGGRGSSCLRKLQSCLWHTEIVAQLWFQTYENILPRVSRMEDLCCWSYGNWELHTRTESIPSKHKPALAIYIASRSLELGSCWPERNQLANMLLPH